MKVIYWRTILDTRTVYPSLNEHLKRALARMDEVARKQRQAKITSKYLKQ